MPIEVERAIRTTEPITVFFHDGDGDPVTGLTPTLRIRAVNGSNGGNFWQASTKTWAATATDDAPLTEISAANWPGAYSYSWPIRGASGVTYHLRADAGTDGAADRYQYGTIFTVRQYIGDLLDDGSVTVVSAYDLTTFIGRCLHKVRTLIDDPANSAKFTDNQILNFARPAWESILVDLNNNTDNPIIVRHDVTVVANQADYVLPPIVGEVLFLAKRRTDGVIEWEVPVRSRWNPQGPGVTFEGPNIRFTPIWDQGDVLQIDFLPTGDVEVHQGESGTFTSSTFTMDPSPTQGSLDTRPNAYAGSLIRLLSSTSSPSVLMQERIITSYNASTQVATISPDWSPALADGDTIKYEIVPILGRLLEEVVCYYTAMIILAVESDTERRDAIEKKYNEMVRAIRLRVSNYENRVGDRFEHDTRQNRDYVPLSMLHSRL